MPHRITVLFDMVLSRRDENAVTRKTVASPKTKPVKGRVKPLRKGSAIPLMIIIPAPRLAPEETPKMYGEASGFRRMDWQTAPLMARQPPAKNASSALGSRKSHTIETFFGSIDWARGRLNILCKIIKIVSARLMPELPSEDAAAIMKSDIIAPMIIFL
jgi:hypothetical protein